MIDKNDPWGYDEFAKEWIAVTDYLKSLPYDLNEIALVPQKEEGNNYENEQKELS